MPERAKFTRCHPLAQILRRALGIGLLLGAEAARADAPAWVDARVTASMQLFEQVLLPGLPGAVTRVEPAWPFTLSAFARGQSGPWSAELSAWGRAGPLDGSLGDGDVTQAWAQLLTGRWRVRLGRQVTLPGSSRYVRFDGLSAGATFGPADLDVYAGWVALPRWSQPRGAWLVGFAGDALLVPALVEAQNRAGQLTWGARAQWRFGAVARASLAWHEQRDGIGLAFRTVSADAVVSPSQLVTVGGRVTFDLSALAFSEARLYADVSALGAPISFDYSFQSPSLLLPKSSVLAAFGGAAWHELGAETTLALLQSVKVTARGSGQLFEGDRAGGRASLKVTWLPGLDGRGLLLAEAGRALVPPSGFTWARLGARWRVAQPLWASADGALYVYDTPVRGTKTSLTGIASVEWAMSARVHGLLSGTVMSTPYAAVELQALARLQVELGTVAEGSTP